MTTPSAGNIELSPERLNEASSWLQAQVQGLEDLKGQVDKAINSFQQDASIEGAIMPAAAPTLEVLKSGAAEIAATIESVKQRVVTLSQGLSGAANEHQSIQDDSAGRIEGS